MRFLELATRLYWVPLWLCPHLSAVATTILAKSNLAGMTGIQTCDDKTQAAALDN